MSKDTTVVEDATALSMTADQLREALVQKEAIESNLAVAPTITADQVNIELFNTQSEIEQHAPEIMAEIGVPANTEKTSDEAIQPTDDSPIDAELVEELFKMLAAATKSKFYMSNPKRVSALTEALGIPVSDDRSFQQFYNHSKRDLESAAYSKSRKSGTTADEVTSADIMAEAHRRYTAKHKTRAIVNEEFEV